MRLPLAERRAEREHSLANDDGAHGRAGKDRQGLIFAQIQRATILVDRRIQKWGFRRELNGLVVVQQVEGRSPPTNLRFCQIALRLNISPLPNGGTSLGCLDVLVSVGCVRTHLNAPAIVSNFLKQRMSTPTRAVKGLI
ncbi:hypothetical protein [Blastochloris tepida]|uniref:Uncharacterized protein n=1 Tax=Blastochloris tepida TaxID=2233851 RepID=A0A348G052_9HYPH|nr:hypothetical protein [Blastochloris tepida]BBF92935.1 hypothetical protein BLTE_16200 [Blastochloris tepida]